MKQIQIDEDLFSRLCAYHLLDKRDSTQEEAIRAGLQAKLDRIIRRTEYTQQCKDNKQQDK